MQLARRQSQLMLLGGLLLAAFAFVMLWRPGSDELGRTASYAVRTFTGLLALVLLWRRGRRGDPTLRRPRMLVAAAIACACLSGILATAYQLVSGRPPPVPSLVDATYFLLLPLAVAGLLAYPSRDLSQGSRLRSLLEGLIGASALWFVTYTLLLDPAGVADGLPFLSAMTVLGYPVSDVLLISLAMSVLSRVRDEARREVVLLASGLSLLAVADLGYSVLQAHGTYRPDSWVAVVAELGLLLMVAAVVLPPAAAAHPRTARAARILPFVPVALVVAGGASRLTGDVAVSGTALPGLLVLVVALVARQAVSERDNTRLLARLAEREELFRSLVTGSSDFISLHAEDGTVRYVSPAAVRILGRSEDQLVGSVLGDFAHAEDLPAASAELTRVLTTPGSTGSYALRIRTTGGEWRWMETVAQNMAANPSVRGTVCNTRDVHERVLLEQRLSHAAFHDALTGLPNRLALVERVESVLTSGRSGALLWLDLDGFKEINDGLGHEVGDEVLREVGRRLAGMVRDPDLVGRLGGDEFVVFCGNGIPEEQAVALAHRVAEVLQQPMRIGLGTHTVSASIGVALTPADDASSLFAAADVAMYEAKRNARGGVRVFDAQLFAELQDRLALTADLRLAVGRGELRLHYQPLVHLSTGRVSGVEALVRWQHPERGLLPPSAFIGLAERNGLIVEIGAWVLEEACAQLARWQRALPEPLRVAVNLSAEQVVDPRLVPTLTSALVRAKADAGLLTLEVTESSVMDDVPGAIAALDALCRLGVRIAIDDFGTGYSSLTYLKQFPVHEVKLDKSFVDGVGTNADDSAIVAAVVNLARAIDLEIVAEGVETSRQEAVLRTLGCDLGQGFLWHRPAPADVIERWVLDRTPASAPPAARRLTAVEAGSADGMDDASAAGT